MHTVYIIVTTTDPAEVLLRVYASLQAAQRTVEAIFERSDDPSHPEEPEILARLRASTWQKPADTVDEWFLVDPEGDLFAENVQIVAREVHEN